MLGLSSQSPPSCYHDRLREELRERRATTTHWERLSETSDVFFSISHALHGGSLVRRLPAFCRWRNLPVYVYMVARYILLCYGRSIGWRPACVKLLVMCWYARLSIPLNIINSRKSLYVTVFTWLSPKILVAGFVSSGASFREAIRSMSGRAAAGIL